MVKRHVRGVPLYVVIALAAVAAMHEAAPGGGGVGAATGRLDLDGDGSADARDARLLRQALGRRAGQAGFDARADLNADGRVDVLDVAAFRGGDLPARPAMPAGPSEQVIIDTPLIELPHCGSGSTLVRLAGNTTPLFGYSLELDITPQGGAGSDVFIDVQLTNFYEPQNLITAGGATMDPLFTVILPAENGGVFVSTNTDDGSTVLAQPGVNDMLAELHFLALPNAVGSYTYTLGVASALSDGDGFAVPFTFVTGTIEVADGALADVNGDGSVNVLDLVGVILAWGPCPDPPDPCPADTNLDGTVNVFDLTNVILTWDCGL